MVKTVTGEMQQDKRSHEDTDNREENLESERGRVVRPLRSSPVLLLLLTPSVGGQSPRFEYR
jgi:hypothetical protein